MSFRFNITPPTLEEKINKETTEFIDFLIYVDNAQAEIADTSYNKAIFNTNPEYKTKFITRVSKWVFDNYYDLQNQIPNLTTLELIIYYIYSWNSKSQHSRVELEIFYDFYIQEYIDKKQPINNLSENMSQLYSIELGETIQKRGGRKTNRRRKINKRKTKGKIRR